MKRRTIVSVSFLLVMSLVCGSCELHKSSDLSISDITVTSPYLSLPWEEEATDVTTSTVSTNKGLKNPADVEYAPFLMSNVGRSIYVDTPVIVNAIESRLAEGPALKDVETAYQGVRFRFFSDDTLLDDIIPMDLTTVLTEYCLSHFGKNKTIMLSDSRADKGYTSYFAVGEDNVPYCFCFCEESNHGLVEANVDEERSSYLEDYADVTYSYVLRGRLASFYALCLTLGDDSDEVLDGTLRTLKPNLLKDRMEVSFNRYAVKLMLPAGIVSYEDVENEGLFNDTSVVDLKAAMEVELSRVDVLPRWRPESYWQDGVANGTLVSVTDDTYTCLGKPLTFSMTADAYGIDKLIAYLKTGLPSIMEEIYVTYDLDRSYILKSFEVDNLAVYSSGDILAHMKVLWRRYDDSSNQVSGVQLRYGAGVDSWEYVVDSAMLYDENVDFE